MDEKDRLGDRFEQHRAHLRSVAYRMLGSLADADDAVQDAWLRVSRAGTAEVENFGGWQPRSSPACACATDDGWNSPAGMTS